MLLKLITACLFAGVVGVGATTTFNNDLNNNNEISIRQENKKYISYDDSNYTITFTADELNNYTWNRLGYYILFCFQDLQNNPLFLESTTMFFNGNTLDYAELSEDVDDFYLLYQTEVNSMYYNVSFSSYDNKFLHDIDGNEVEFGYSLSWHLNDDNYNDIKAYVEDDIEANQDTSPFMLPVLQEVVSLLTSGISALAVGIGGGVSTLVSAIFISNGALSPFGAIIIVFSGIALAIGLSRWVMNFLTSLGAKK